MRPVAALAVVAVLSGCAHETETEEALTGAESDDNDGVVTIQGDIFCQVERRKTFGPKLGRLRYEGDEETHLRALKVLCTIYPETPEQIDALATALSELPGVRD
jgi:hypothetical protein